MKWMCSYEFKPKHGTQIFIWDMDKQQQVLLNAFWDENSWKPEAWAPVWRYVLSGLKPIPIKPAPPEGTE